MSSVGSTPTRFRHLNAAEAKDLKLGRHVAPKFSPDDPANDTQDIQVDPVVVRQVLALVVSRG